MKKLFSFFLFLSQVSFFVYSQRADSINKELEFIGDFYFKDSINTSLLNLEKHKCSYKSQGNASLYITSVGKVKGVNYVNGVSSPTIISKDSLLKFIVRVTLGKSRLTFNLYSINNSINKSNHEKENPLHFNPTGSLFRCS